MCISRILNSCGVIYSSQPCIPYIYQKVRTAVEAVFVAYALGVNPTICGTILVISFFASRAVLKILTEELMDPLTKHPFQLGTAIAVYSFCAPHFALMIALVVHCAYTSSRFKVYLTEKPILNEGRI